MIKCSFLQKPSDHDFGERRASNEALFRAKAFDRTPADVTAAMTRPTLPPSAAAHSQHRFNAKTANGKAIIQIKSNANKYYRFENYW